LAPASILITRLEIEAVVRKAIADGVLGAWVDAGPLSYLLLFVGLGSFVAAIISLFVDFRRAR
jgi:hypothetical protein